MTIVILGLAILAAFTFHSFVIVCSSSAEKDQWVINRLQCQNKSLRKHNDYLRSQKIDLIKSNWNLMQVNREQQMIIRDLKFQLTQYGSLVDPAKNLSHRVIN